MELTFSDVLRRLALWTGVCSVSAAPSFIWASSEFDQAAMLAAVGCFILLLTAMTCTRRFARFKRRPFMRRTLYIGYGTRVALSLAFPIGMMADLYPGFASLALVDLVGLDAKTFVGTFVATMVQGTILNIIISLFMLVVYAFQRAFLPAPPATGSCERCGYDLRGSMRSGVCPECGTAIGPETRRLAA